MNVILFPSGYRHDPAMTTSSDIAEMAREIAEDMARCDCATSTSKHDPFCSIEQAMGDATEQAKRILNPEDYVEDEPGLKWGAEPIGLDVRDQLEAPEIRPELILVASPTHLTRVQVRELMRLHGRTLRHIAELWGLTTKRVRDVRNAGVIGKSSAAQWIEFLAQPETSTNWSAYVRFGLTRRATTARQSA